ncbi:MAG: histidine--tRNA ligase [Ignisphaera sp.]|nr:histidine--tRNA ligase [Ignisphaera sp.]MCX8167998.1 histidine--tRNA ligase [Ignisphaera sp.]MDW8085531.1 histidine--tRNA ligase [Ignisphaera sp.]
MKELYEPVRGFRDYVPPESEVISWICSVFREVAESFGYREIKTPIVESFRLFAMKSGEEIRESMYVFKDKGGREVALRPELTPSVVRVYLRELRAWPKPVRLFYIGDVFRYDEPQLGRYRGFTQAGVEILGADDLNYDVELIEILEEFYDRIALKERIYKVNNVAIFRDLAIRSNLDESSVERLLHLLDKGLFNEAAELFEARGAVRGARIVREVARYRGANDVQPLVSILESEGVYSDFRMHIDSIVKYIDFAKSIGARVILDPAFARGIAYYTGIIFEVAAPPLSISIAGGGRYDNLTAVYGGEELPSTGFAVGVERTMLALSSQGQGPSLPRRRRVLLLLLVKDPPVFAEISSIARDIRRKGVVVQIEMLSAAHRLGRWLEYASKEGFNYAVIVGKRELERRVVLVRDMERWEQHEVSIDRLAEFLVG